MSGILKLFIILSIALIFSFIVLWFGENSGAIIIKWLGYKISISSNFFILGVIIIIITSYFLIWLLGAILKLPYSFRNSYRSMSEDRNYKLLERGILNLLATDVSEAKTDYERIKNTLPKNNEKYKNLFYAFEAKLNQAEGNYLLAKNSYEKLAENKNTRFFGVKGLLEVASLSGNMAQAANHAEQAYKLKPDFKDGAHSLLELYKNSGEIDKAFNFVNKYKSRFRFRKDHSNQIDTDKELSELWIRKVKKLESYDETNQLKRMFIFNHIIKALKYDPANYDAINYLLNYSEKLKEYSKLKKYYRIYWKYNQNFELTKKYLEILFKEGPKRKKLVKSELAHLQKLKNNIDIIEKLTREL